MADKKLVLPVLDLAGNKVSDKELDASVFATEVNNQVMFDAVQVYQANCRQATAKTKKRAEVSGGGKKPWRQKGTGRARAGSSRSPLWRHGGIVFGPTGVQNFKLAQNRKEHRLALKSALTVKVAAESMVLVNDFNVESVKTKDMVKVLEALKAQPKSLLVVNNDNEVLVRVSRNIPGVSVVKCDNVSVYDLLNSDCVIMDLDAVNHIEEVLR